MLSHRTKGVVIMEIHGLLNDISIAYTPSVRVTFPLACSLLSISNSILTLTPSVTCTGTDEIHV